MYLALLPRYKIYLISYADHHGQLYNIRRVILLSMYVQRSIIGFSERIVYTSC